MEKNTLISSYEQMNDAELIAEVQQRRREIQQPKLDWKEKLSNFFISTSVFGFSFASTLGVILNIRKPTKGGFSESLNELIDSSNKREYIKSKPNFKRTVYYSTGLFALTSAIAAPIINSFQKTERSEDNATKYMFGKDELFRRGYMQTETGDFTKMDTSVKVRSKQHELLQRIESLESDKTFQSREQEKMQQAVQGSPSIH